MRLRKACIIPTALFFLFAFSCKPAAKDMVRQPAHAGGFYPGDPGVLGKMVEDVLASAATYSGPRPNAVIVPHAGYIYSGPTAAYSYRALRDTAPDIERVILMGPSHYAPLEGVILNAKSYATPLGVYPLDRDAVKKLKASGFAWASNFIAETREHSDEVQIPFLQKALPHAKLVPLVVGDMDKDTLLAAAKAIAPLLDDKTVLVISSDFTHYGPNYDYIPKFKQGVEQGLKDMDGTAVQLITQGDLEGFAGFLNKTQSTICGRNPILLGLAVLRESGLKIEGALLHYDTSGHETSDWTNSVSYCAISLWHPAAVPEKAKPGEKAQANIKGGAGLQNENFLSTAEEKTLLKLARFVLEKFVGHGQDGFSNQDLKDMDLTANLKKEFGVFVTLNEGGRLRGCIGHIVPRFPVYQGVIENAMNAAARDPRFPAVTAQELKDIKIEISVMSPLMDVKSLDEIVVGRDGLVLTNGRDSGVFLPQVPVEWHWDKKTYLEELGMKAGLDRGAYKRPNTQLKRFTAQVFGEE